MKSLLLCVGVSAAMSSVGCASPVHGMSYNIMMDSDSLSVDQQADIVQGALAWEQAVPGLTFTFETTPCHDYGNWYHTICIFVDPGAPNPSAIGLAYATTYLDEHHAFLTSPNDASGDSTTVHMWGQQITKYNSSSDSHLFLNAVTHEIGHSITHCGTHIAYGNLMSPGADGSTIEKITQDDINYFYAAR